MRKLYDIDRGQVIPHIERAIEWIDQNVPEDDFYSDMSRDEAQLILRGLEETLEYLQNGT